MDERFNRFERSSDAAASDYAVEGLPAGVSAADRGVFIARTYIHLLIAILAFVGIEVAIFQSGLADRIALALAGTNWLIVLGGFVLVSWLATKVSMTADSVAAQYAALAAFVGAEALIFVPLLYIADKFAPGTIQSAGLCTLLGFGGLTLVAFGTRRDFSFMRGILAWAGICALLAIVGSVVFGFQLGTFFSVVMVALAGASILYDTSNILHHYPANRYVGAALALFASVAMMFWYILRIFIDSRR